MPSKPRVIYWFRTDLRLHDSPALKAALDLDPECLYPVWTWDPHYVYRSRVGPNRFQFLIDCQNDLSKSLTKLNNKQKLFLLREAPQTLFPKLFKAWNVSHLVFEKDTDAYARQRDKDVTALAQEAGVEVITRCGRTLWDSDELIKANGGKPTMSITQVQVAGKKLGEIAKPLPAPEKLPDPGDLDLEFDHEQPPENPDYNAAQRSSSNKTYHNLAGPNGDFAVPTLEELGMPAATTPHKGGESIALKMLDDIVEDRTYTATFEKPKTAPTAFEPQSTTLMSPHLHFGSLSCREYYWRVQEVVDNYKGQASHPPTSLTGQLLFRDMYFAAQAGLGYSFAQTFNNSHCRFIPWHLPSTIDEANDLITGNYTIDNTEAEHHFRRWKHGITGFPWIDALMRQLKQEGWIHHLGRHAVACFLTRGGCYVDWERGAEVFEEWLIDHEVACNVGNWQWLACVAFYSQFYRCYSPIAFPQKWDKDGGFVRRYVPELAEYDKKYIYEPWKAPIADQRRWACRIDGDGSQTEKDGMRCYPKPMFDFAERRQICLDGMKKAYEVGLYGNDERVLNGTWRALFDDKAEGPTKGTKGLPGAAVKGAKVTHADATRAEKIDIGERSGASSANRGPKRSAGQGTLDGMVKRTRLKK